MGCESCRQKEPEKSFPLIQNPEEMNQLPDSFNDYVPTIGQYYKSDFESLIPQNIKDYMSNNPLQIPEDYCKDLETFEAEPIEFKNGNIYKGNWIKNLGKQFTMEGKGELYVKGGDHFVEGIWLEGNLKFARIFKINEDNFEVYEGEIKNSLYDGKGKYISSNGDEYIGNFVEGEKAGGEGKITFKDGTTYEGQLEKGEIKGEGKMIWQNGYEYQGNFDGKKLEGFGTLKGPNGETYEGEFSNNLFSGNGKYTYQNGNTYEGQFSYGVKKGKGVYKCLDKFEYEGDWDNDLPNGVGKLSTWNKNAVIKSSWRSGEIMEMPNYEKGTKEDFNDIDFNIVTDAMLINIKDLTNLDYSEIQTNEYKLGTEPSFLED